MNNPAHYFKTAPAPSPRAYSYTRFSTPEQAAGDSQRRQSDAAAKWAERRGVVLDQTLSRADAGVSAYRGANLSEDRGLGEFLAACRQGLIEPGSFLIVESLDRISRMTPRRCQRLLDDIVDAGVTIVTLSDGQEYDQQRLDNDPTALLIALMVSWRAHEESKTKGRRVAAAWAEKRRKVRAGEAALLTRRSPPWLSWRDGAWAIDEARAEVVRRVFRMATEGVGEHRIAEQLNREGTTPLGRGMMWHRSAVSKLLRSPTVIGTLTPGHMEFDGPRKRRVLELPIANAYPAIVPEADWLAVRAIKDGATTAITGRGARAPLSNVLAGLARCPDCGVAMTRVMKGKGNGQPRLVCTRAKAGAASHSYTSVRQADVESALFDHWEGLWADIPAGDAGGALDADCAALEAEADYVEDRIETLSRHFDRAPSNALAANLRATEAQLAALREASRALNERRSVVDGGLIHGRMATLHEAMEARSSDGPLEPVNAALRSLFDAVVVDHHSGTLRFQWKQGGESSLIYAWPADAEASIKK